jgi:hypothetical protein
LYRFTSQVKALAAAVSGAARNGGVQISELHNRLDTRLWSLWNDRHEPRAGFMDRPKETETR